MSSPHPHPNAKPAADFKVDDPAAAFLKMEEFTRRLLAVPKKEIDKRMPKKSAKPKRRN